MGKQSVLTITKEEAHVEQIPPQKKRGNGVMTLNLTSNIPKDPKGKDKSSSPYKTRSHSEAPVLESASEKGK